MNGFDGYDIEVGSAYGIRRWQVDSLGRLIAQSAGTVWTPGVNVAECTGGGSGGAVAISGTMTWNNTITATIAECSTCARAEKAAAKTDRKKHTVPAEGCGCGFWAYHQGAARYGEGGLVGVIEASGRTIIGTQGFRSAQAKIVALSLPPEPQSKPDIPSAVAKSRWWHRAPMFPFYFFGCLFGFVGAALGFSVSPWFFAATALGLTSGFLAWREEFTWRDDRNRSNGSGFITNIRAISWGEAQYPDLTPDLIERVKRNYPDVVIFPDAAAMLAEFPVSQALEPTPDTDPEFWTRPAVTS